MKEFGNLAKATNTLILPAERSNLGAAVASISTVLLGPHPAETLVRN